MAVHITQSVPSNTSRSHRSPVPANWLWAHWSVAPLSAPAQTKTIFRSWSIGKDRSKSCATSSPHPPRAAFGRPAGSCRLHGWNYQGLRMLRNEWVLVQGCPCRHPYFACSSWCWRSTSRVPCSSSSDRWTVPHWARRLARLLLKRGNGTYPIAWEYLKPSLKRSTETWWWNKRKAHPYSGQWWIICGCARITLRSSWPG